LLYSRTDVPICGQTNFEPFTMNLENFGICQQSGHIILHFREVSTKEEGRADETPEREQELWFLKSEKGIVFRTDGPPLAKPSDGKPIGTGPSMLRPVWHPKGAGDRLREIGRPDCLRA
jgi:hypothetical protein